jgi:putative DNA primase/helicase
MDMMPIEKVLSRLNNVKQTNKHQWEAQCPCHDDSKNSLCIGMNEVSGTVMVRCQACGDSAPARNIATAIGLTMKDFRVLQPRNDFDNRQNPNGSHGTGYSLGASGSGNPGKRSKPYSKIVKTYDYRDEDGKLLYQACRMEPKTFKQRQQLENGNFIWNIQGVRRVLYRLPELLAYKKQCQAEGKIPRVIIVEGEKDVDRLRQLGYCATTNVFGANQSPTSKKAIPGTKNTSSKWLEEYSPFLVDCDVVFSPDNDKPGQDHVDYVAASILRAADAAESQQTTVRVVAFPQPEPPAKLPKGYDVSDYLDGIPEKKDKDTDEIIPPFPAMGDADSLANLIETAAEWIPQAGPTNNDDQSEEAKTLDNDTRGPHVIEADDDPHRLARLNFERYRKHRSGLATIRYWRQEWLKWSKNTYEIFPEDELRSYVIRTTKEEFDRINIERQQSAEKTIPVVKPVTKGLVTNIIEVTKSLAMLPSDIELNTWSQCWNTPAKTQRQQFIALENGILDINRTISDDPDTDESNCLFPNTPEWFSTASLPYKFDSTATCPKFTDFLDKVMAGDQERIDLLVEWMGYCLTTDTSQQKFMILEGEGGNGKSVFLAALGAMLGKDNCSYVPMESFGQRFETTPLVGKLLNICSDVGELDAVSEGWLKAYTGGGPMNFDRKHKPPLQCVPTARLILSCNAKPRFKDRSFGLVRRMLIVPFRYQIKESEKTLGMDQPQWWMDQGEMPGIFNLALTGLTRVRQNGKFTIPKASAEALEVYQREMNPTREFLLDNFRQLDETTGGSSIIRCKFLREHYLRWCESHGYKPLGEGMLGKEVGRIFPAVQRKQKRTDKSRVWIYIGLKFKTAEIEGFATEDKILDDLKYEFKDDSDYEDQQKIIEF